MMYKVTKNGELVIITPWYKNAAREYDKCIYNGKPGDIINLFCRKEKTAPWELARKDWL